MASRYVTAVLAVWLFTVVCGAILPAAASAADGDTVPRLIALSGVARAPRSEPVTLTFRFYAEAEAAAPLWEESQTIELGPAGRYDVLIGSATQGGLPAELFAANGARWLGVQVNREDEQPRMMLLSVPYALKAGDADTLGGMPASAFLTDADVTKIEESVADEAAARAAADTTLQNNINNLAADAVLGVNAGFGLTGGGASGVVSLAVDPTTLQSRVNGVCGSGSAMISVNADGSVNCVSVDTNGGDDITSLNPGTGIAVGGSGNSRTITNTGDTNMMDDITSLNAGTGIAVGGSGNSRTITNTGDTNMMDDITSLNAGTGITIGGSGNSRTITNTGDPNAADDITSLSAGNGISIGGSGNSRTIGASGNFGGNVAVAGDLNVGDDLIVDGDLFVSGAKSSTARLSDGRTVALYAVESPENWFEDFGSAQLTNGVTAVQIDAAFRDTINVDVTYHVFLTPTGDCRGLYVAEKTATGFEVRELGGGTSSVAFDYRIVARRRGFENIRLEEVEVSGSAGGTQ